MRRKYGPLIGLPVNNSASNFAGAALALVCSLPVCFFPSSCEKEHFQMTTSVTALTIPPWLTERGIIASPSGGKRHRSRQELYDELRNALSEAIREGDRDALNGFIESEVLYHIAPADIPSLWD